jgi:hypothetical protein
MYLGRNHYIKARCFVKLRKVYMDTYALKRTITENSKQIFQEKELLGHGHNFHIRVCL